MPGFYSPSISKGIILPAALLSALFSALIWGCAGAKAIPVPTEVDVKYAGLNGHATNLEAMTLGRKLYISRCSACHNLEMPAAYSAAKWPYLVEKRVEDAEINPEQQRLITAYLVGVAAAAQDKSATAVPVNHNPVKPRK